ncbi:MAG: membrane protein insertion efficiency factor YidD [Candidatus Dojkabacteria bacterium]
MIRFIFNIPKNIGKFLIRIYQKLFSFDHSFWAKYIDYRVCIHEPSCSQYTYEAVDRFGLIRGSIMGFFRILRCNPMAEGGYDPVPKHFSIKRNTDI